MRGQRRVGSRRRGTWELDLLPANINYNIDLTNDE